MQLKQVPDIIRLNEAQPMQNLILSRYLDISDNETLTYMLASDQRLPSGLELDEKQGIISGTPAAGSGGIAPHDVKIEVSNEEETITLPLQFVIFKALTTEEIEQLRHQTWENLANNHDIPESLQTIIDRPISKNDIFYLLERYASFTIWNADDLRLANKGSKIDIEGASSHFLIFDFEVCLVATPKDLFTYDRTLVDASKTARAMAQEVYRRKWHVEFGGYDRMANAAWYEARRLSLEGEHQMEVRNYEPPAIQQLQEQHKPTA